NPFVSRRPIRFLPGPNRSIRLVVEPGGTPVAVRTPIDGSAEFTFDEMARGIPLELADRLVLLLHLVDRTVEDAAEPLGMVGASAGIRQVRRRIERVRDLEVPVLIRGETGTGKELVARAIHDKSPCRDGPFLSVNLGAIRELATSALFGSTKGAFTGALREREGLFRAADGGTLFLDELGEAAAEVQAALLRVLETGEIFPLGADEPIATKVRLIAATDANLEDHINRGQFKAPLFHRLSTYEVRLPPLRERREDIGPLFYHFAREDLTATGEAFRLTPQDPYARPWLPAYIAAQLVRYSWPGNIRELRNITRQLVIESRGSTQVRLDPRVADQLGVIKRPGGDALPVPPPSDPAIAVPRPTSDSATVVPRPAADPGGDARRKPSDVSEAELTDALRAVAWDLKAAADRLRIPRSSIYDLIERYPHIRVAGHLGTEEITECFRLCGGDLDAMVERLQVSRRALNRRLRELGLAPRVRTPTRPPRPGTNEEG
ncbi:MAG TPA: sigma 54-interacting transcriptional regulator, partial [Kofleriaceae bacterium]|nr:sigma 54-interacting transcriptional regulator [Kofleriaceae bacterium]